MTIILISLDSLPIWLTLTRSGCRKGTSMVVPRIIMTKQGAKQATKGLRTSGLGGQEG